MRALADATLAAIPERRVAAVGRLTGMAYALKHEELLVRVNGIAARSYAMGAAWLRTVVDERELPMRPDLLVRVLHATIEGLVFQRLLTPELVPDDVFHAAFEAFATRRGKE